MWTCVKKVYYFDKCKKGYYFDMCNKKNEMFSGSQKKKPVFQTIHYGKDATQNYQCLNTCACYHTSLWAYIQTQKDENAGKKRQILNPTTLFS